MLYVNQEMVLRLGAVTGVGHARLIPERFGKFWGAFSVIDLFLLNTLILVTEFIGITLVTGYLGLPKVASAVVAAAIIIASAFTGSFQRFECIAIALCASLNGCRADSGITVHRLPTSHSQPQWLPAVHPFADSDRPCRGPGGSMDPWWRWT